MQNLFDRSLLFFGALLIVGLTWLVYAPGLTGSFIFDDLPNLVSNEHWKVTDLVWKQWARAASHGEASALGRPLALLSFAINHYFTGTDPWALKATNLGFHCLNAVLVWTLSYRVIRDGTGAAISTAKGLSFVVATLWSAHPVHVSTVLYVVQRMEVGALTFTLLALLAYCQARRAQQTGKRTRGLYCASALAMLAGLGFKETAALTPLFVLLLEIFCYRFRGPDSAVSGTLVKAYVAGAALILIIYFFVLLPTFLSSEGWLIRDHEPLQRLLSQGPILLLYLSQIVWPDPGRLTFYYDQLSYGTGILSPAGVLLGWTAIGSLLLVAHRLRNLFPLISLGILFFFASHAITSNIVPLELAFEHRNYFATFGVLLAASSAGHHLLVRFGQSLRALVAAPVIAALGLMTFIHADTWGNRLELGLALATRNPESVRASYGLAVEFQLSSLGKPTSPMWSLALGQMRETAKIERGAPLGEQGEIVMFAQIGKQAEEEVWNRLREKLLRRKAGADDRAVLQAIVRCSLKHTCKIDHKQVQLTLMLAAEKNPDSADILSQYANFAFNRMNDSPLAITLIKRAAQLEPRVYELQAALLKYQLASNSISRAEALHELRVLEDLNSDGRLDKFIVDIRALMK